MSISECSGFGGTMGADILASPYSGIDLQIDCAPKLGFEKSLH
jgi:hypothetical protein